MSEKIKNTLAPAEIVLEEARMPTRFLLVEDHPIFASGLRQLLEANLGWQCVGVVDQEQQALASLDESTPDVAIIDLALRRGSGLGVIAALAERHPAVRRVVLSSSTGAETEAAIAAHGGALLLDKQLGPAELVSALAAHVPSSVRLDERLNRLSSRELQVLQLIGQGKTTQEMAQLLYVSTKTIETHRAHIKRKLEVADVYKLVRIGANALI
jgi:DNA-binding NarL/FixJ family response regulator